MKWNSSDISLFLQVYQQFPKLWNIKGKDYSNKSLRDASFKRLMSELQENQLLGAMDAKLLKAKIKSIKDVYRAELEKIEKSKKSGCGTDEVYVPKLSWFKDATYLSDVMSTRSVVYIKFDLNQSQNSEQDEEGCDTIDPAMPGIANNSTVEINTVHSSGFIKPHEPPRKRFRKNVETDNGEISQAIKKLDILDNGSVRISQLSSTRVSSINGFRNWFFERRRGNLTNSDD